MSEFVRAPDQNLSCKHAWSFRVSENLITLYLKACPVLLVCESHTSQTYYDDS